MIKTSRLILRTIIPADIDHVYAGLSHPNVVRYYGFRCNNYEDAQRQMQWYADLEDAGTGKWWAICSGIDQGFLGAAGFNDLNKSHAVAQIGFWLLPEAWGNGYMKEALPFIIQYGFDKMNLQTIVAEVESNNISSKKVLESNGFIYQRIKENAEVKEGQPIDLEYWHLVKLKS